MRTSAAVANYEQHFGLTEPLFAADDDEFPNIVFGEYHEQLIQSMAMALAAPDAVVTLTGQPGVGKTTLAAAAAKAALGPDALVWITVAPESAQELIESVLLELGLETRNVSRIEGTCQWKHAVRERLARGLRTVLLVEDAHTLSPRVLKSLHAITSNGPDGHGGVAVVLMGLAELDRLLFERGLEPLQQRISLRGVVQPMSGEDLHDFIEHRIKKAGGDVKRILGPGSVAMLYCYSGGIPRVARKLCEAALNRAAADGRRSMTAHDVRDVAIELHGVDRVSAYHRQAGLVPVEHGDEPFDRAPAEPETLTDIEALLTLSECDVPTLTEDVPTLTEIVGDAAAAAARSGYYGEAHEATASSDSQSASDSAPPEVEDDASLGGPGAEPATDRDEDSYAAALAEALRASGQ
jgi:general secretion pathway protein A